MNRRRLLLAACLAVVFELTAGPVASDQELETGEGCRTPRLTLVRPMDFGDVRVPNGASGFVAVDPRGAISQSTSVLLHRDPAPGEMQLCGPADARIAVIVTQPSLALRSQGDTPVARRVDTIVLAGDGIRLQRVEPGRWEGRLGSSGRAVVRVGGTLYLEAGGRHGTAGADLILEAVLP